MNPRFHLVRAILCSFTVLLLAASASAQFRAAVQGTVFDPNNAGVVGATVTLTNTETNKTQQTTTSSDGVYRFTELPPGKYTLTAEMAGFKKQSLENVIVGAEQTLGVNIQLEAGGISETVTVTDQVGQQIETENANVDRNVSTMEIQRLPQFGRDPYELTRLTPGVFGDFARGGAGTAVSLPNQSGPGGSNRSIFQTENQPQISANGQRVSANSFQIDGTSVNSLTWGGAAVVTPNQESVREVQVIANSYSAEYGRNSGAQVLTVSQSGSNDYHGSLFLKNNSPGLNAFNKYGGPGPNGSSLPGVRNNQHYNQFGGSIGGPIPIPQFGEGPGPIFKMARNKAFFFFSYEGLRSNTSGVFNATVETPQYRQLIQQLRPGSPTARILGAPGIEPRITSVIPVTCEFLNFNNTNCQQVPGGLDLGSPAGATGQYLSFGQLQGGGFDGIPDIQFAQIAAPQTSSGNQFNPRIDLNLTSLDTVTFSSYISRFNGFSSDVGGRSRPMGDVTTAPRNFFAMLTYVRTISPTTINEARINATRFAFNELQSSSQTNWGLPRIEIETYPGDRIRFGPPWAETTPGIFAQNTYEFRDTLRMSHGNHGLSLGVDINWEQNNNNLLGGSRPLYTFAGLFNFANST
ncbi:MAG TPA: carboxypeptidase-like regulatory domain-containing protein, partial [Pyrinomonadaceae bacterium]|nr:carboxypeptidase-like regulatory domain-containing protein [Pyrinomonadaceae bacterium]